MPHCAQVRLPACGRDVHAEQLPQRHGKGGMTDTSAVSCALSRTAARLLARLICTRPDPIARARSLPSTRVRPDARRRPVFKMTGVPKRPGPSSTANRRALRPPAARLLAPSRPQRPPGRTPILTPTTSAPTPHTHSPLTRRRSSPSPLFLIFLLSLLVPLAPLAPLPPLAPLSPLAPLFPPPLLLCFAARLAVCARSWVGRGSGLRSWRCFALGDLLQVIRSRCSLSRLSLLSPLMCKSPLHVYM